MHQGAEGKQESNRQYVKYHRNTHLNRETVRKIRVVGRAELAASEKNRVEEPIPTCCDLDVVVNVFWNDSEVERATKVGSNCERLLKFAKLMQEGKQASRWSLTSPGLKVEGETPTLPKREASAHERPTTGETVAAAREARKAVRAKRIIRAIYDFLLGSRDLVCWLMLKWEADERDSS